MQPPAFDADDVPSLPPEREPELRLFMANFLGANGYSGEELARAAAGELGAEEREELRELLLDALIARGPKKSDEANAEGGLIEVWLARLAAPAAPPPPTPPAGADGGATGAGGMAGRTGADEPLGWGPLL